MGTGYDGTDRVFTIGINDTSLALKMATIEGTSRHSVCTNL